MLTYFSSSRSILSGVWMNLGWRIIRSLVMILMHSNILIDRIIIIFISDLIKKPISSIITIYFTCWIWSLLHKLNHLVSILSPPHIAYYYFYVNGHHQHWELTIYHQHKHYDGTVLNYATTQYQWYILNPKFLFRNQYNCNGDFPISATLSLPAVTQECLL